MSSDISDTISAPSARRQTSIAFHIVDLVAHVGLHQHRPVGDLALADAGAMEAAQPHLHALRHGEAALEQKQVAVGQEGAVGDVEIVAARHGEDALARPVEHGGKDVALPVEALFR